MENLRNQYDHETSALNTSLSLHKRENQKISLDLEKSKLGKQHLEETLQSLRQKHEATKSALNKKNHEASQLLAGKNHCQQQVSQLTNEFNKSRNELDLQRQATAIAENNLKRTTLSEQALKNQISILQREKSHLAQQLTNAKA